LSGSQNSVEYDEMLIDAQSCFLQKKFVEIERIRKKEDESSRKLGENKII